MGVFCNRCSFNGPQKHFIGARGQYTLDNCTVACGGCNSSKGYKLLEEWK